MMKVGGEEEEFVGGMMRVCREEVRVCVCTCLYV